MVQQTCVVFKRIKFYNLPPGSMVLAIASVETKDSREAVNSPFNPIVLFTACIFFSMVLCSCLSPHPKSSRLNFWFFAEWGMALVGVAPFTHLEALQRYPVSGPSALLSRKLARQQVL